MRSKDASPTNPPIQRRASREPEGAQPASAVSDDVARAAALGHGLGDYRETRAESTEASGSAGESSSEGISQELGQAPGERLQRDVGFEIEMLVAADIDGQDAPEKVTHYKKGGTELTIDHGGTPILNATKLIEKRAKAAQSGYSATGAYHSILEIVTRHKDVATESGKKNALREIGKASELALAIFKGTNALRERRPLSEIVPTSSTLSVGLDVARWKIPQVQTLDAHIQASVGVDLAQIPTFFKEVGGLKRSRLTRTEMKHEDSLTEAASAGPKILKELRTMMLRGGMGDKLAKGQNFVNLEGLFTTVALYLIAGKKTLFGVGSVWKNFTPLLSRVDLSVLYKNATTPEERELVESEGAVEGLVDMILDATGRSDMEPLLLGVIPYGKYFLPSCGQFIRNVLTGKTDGVMEILEDAEDFKPSQPESVGGKRVSDDLTSPEGGKKPEDRRRRGAIFEIRTLKQRKELMDGLEDRIRQIETGRYDFNSWYAVAAEIIDFVQQLNQIVFGVEEETEEELELRLEYEEYMRQREDEI